MPHADGQVVLFDIRLIPSGPINTSASGALVEVVSNVDVPFSNLTTTT